MKQTKMQRLSKSPDYRHTYINGMSDGLIAAQIKANREAQGLSQAELAEKAGMKQSAISRLENVNYDAWSVRTLRRVAQALDIALTVKFDAFSEALPYYTSFRPKNLRSKPFAEDTNTHCTNSAEPVQAMKISLNTGGSARILTFPASKTLAQPGEPKYGVALHG